MSERNCGKVADFGIAAANPRARCVFWEAMQGPLPRGGRCNARGFVAECMLGQLPMSAGLPTKRFDAGCPGPLHYSTSRAGHGGVFLCFGRGLPHPYSRPGQSTFYKLSVKSFCCGHVVVCQHTILFINFLM